MTADPVVFRDYQILDLARKINNPNDLLLHDPGVGKTPIACALTRHLYEQNGWKAVWSQPSGIMAKNRRELLRFGGFQPDEVVLVQGTPQEREHLMQTKTAKVFLMTATGYSAEWGKLLQLQPTVKQQVNDEWHLAYQGLSAKRTEEWIRVTRKMKATSIMTGTILKGKLNSAYPALHALFPLYYGSERNFLNQHGVYDENGKRYAWQRHEKLGEILGKVGIRRSFESVYGEEAKVIQVEPVELEKVQRAKYEEWETRAILELEDSWLEAQNPGVAAMRARQILAHPETFGIVPAGYKTAKDDALEVHIADSLHSGERLVIFSVLIPEQERIARLCKKLGARTALINGNVSGTKRQEIDTAFCAGELDIVVASPPTAGIGFNWGFLKKMVFASVDYTDDSFFQAYRRGIRGVRESALLIIVLCYVNTIEERILQIVDMKSGDANKVDNTYQKLRLSKL